jgi:aerobic-type carbon monoxide dehydrogenase small subunit (CoxS/CutS family)
MEVAALGGCIACTVNGVRREAEVEPRLLIDYFLRESLGLTNIVKAIQSAAGPCAVRPVLKEGEPWRKDRSQARPRLRSTPSAR